MGLDALADEAAALAGEPAAAAGEAAAPAGDVALPRSEAAQLPVEGVLRREGDVWALTWGATTARVRHSKGIADLAVLVARPGVEVHVRQLEADVGTVAPARAGAEPRLDRRAVAEYRARLADLEDDLAVADDRADLERAARLRAERDFLVAELGGAFGLGGRPRPAAGDVDERLRKAVGARIRDALRRLDQVHPAAAHHLRHSVRTGLFCVYRPERPTAWRVPGD